MVIINVLGTIDYFNFISRKKNITVLECIRCHNGFSLECQKEIFYSTIEFRKKRSIFLPVINPPEDFLCSWDVLSAMSIVPEIISHIFLPSGTLIIELDGDYQICYSSEEGYMNITPTVALKARELFRNLYNRTKILMESPFPLILTRGRKVRLLPQNLYQFSPEEVREYPTDFHRQFIERILERSGIMDSLFDETYLTRDTIVFLQILYFEDLISKRIFIREERHSFSPTLEFAESSGMRFLIIKNGNLEAQFLF